MEISAADILKLAIDVQVERGVERDSDDGERRMGTIVKMFNLLYGTELTVEQGWGFMVCLKLARSVHGRFTLDDYTDGASYFSLMGEAAAEERGAK